MMADAQELAKSNNRSELNELAAKAGITDAADETKYVTKADLAEAIVAAGGGESEQSGEEEQKSDEQEQVEEQAEQPAPTPEILPTPPIDSPDDVLDDSGVEDAPGTADEDDEEDDEEEEPTPAPTRRGAAQANDEEGMGFPRKNGKTLSVFSNKPHETVRNVGGVMVPMTNEEAVGDSTKGVLPKTDAEVIAKLKKLGKM